MGVGASLCWDSIGITCLRYSAACLSSSCCNIEFPSVMEGLSVIVIQNGMFVAIKRCFMGLTL